MNQLASTAKMRRREPVEVLEPKKPDRRFDQLTHVRKQRLRRYEREHNEIRKAWRSERCQLHIYKLQWREQLQEARQFWEGQREAFFQMTISSTTFRTAKFTYQRKLTLAAQTQLDAREQAMTCRQVGAKFFAALAQVRQARLRQEKLDFLCNEMKTLLLIESE